MNNLKLQKVYLINLVLFKYFLDQQKQTEN